MKSFSTVLILAVVSGFTKILGFRCDDYYFVQNDETCKNIASSYKLKESDLKLLNPEMDCKKLKEGQILCVKPGKKEIKDDDLNEEMHTMEDEILKATQYEKEKGKKKDDKDTSKMNNESLDKRNIIKECKPISKGNIKLIKKNYKYDIPQYQEQEGSVATAIHNINGCSFPKMITHLNKDKFFQDSNKKLFTPACNSHDVCYNCYKGRNHCDKLFKTNLIDMCKKQYNKKLSESNVNKKLGKYTKSKKIAGINVEYFDEKAYKASYKKLSMEEKCVADAIIFYKSISTFAPTHYYAPCLQGKVRTILSNTAYESTNSTLENSKPFETCFEDDPKCAYCGLPIIKNTLLKKPFYV